MARSNVVDVGELSNREHADALRLLLFQRRELKMTEASLKERVDGVNDALLRNLVELGVTAVKLKGAGTASIGQRESSRIDRVLLENELLAVGLGVETVNRVVEAATAKTVSAPFVSFRMER